MNKKITAAAGLAAALILCSCGADEAAQGEVSATAAVYKEIPAQTEVQADETAETAAEPVPTAKCSDITAEILACVKFPSMAEVGTDRVGAYLDCVIPENADFSMFICGSGGFADEICVINSAELDTAAVEEAVTKRIESRKKDFEGYNPDEFDKLGQYIIEIKDGYLMYAITADNDVCSEIFDKYVK